MGLSVNAQDDLESEYVNCVNTLLKILVDRIFSPILSNGFLYLFSETYRKEKHCLKVVHEYTRTIINKRKAEFYSDSKNYEQSVDSFGRKKRRAFLDLLLEYATRDSSFTEDDITQEVDTFMFEVIQLYF